MNRNPFDRHSTLNCSTTSKKNSTTEDECPKTSDNCPNAIVRIPITTRGERFVSSLALPSSNSYEIRMFRIPLQGDTRTIRFRFEHFEEERGESSHFDDERSVTCSVLSPRIEAIFDTERTKTRFRLEERREEKRRETFQR